MLVGKINDADKALKSLSAEGRLAHRKETVSLIVDKYVEFVDSIDTSDPLISNRLKDAVNNSRNQKEYLCRFLTLQCQLRSM